MENLEILQILRRLEAGTADRAAEVGIVDRAAEAGTVNKVAQVGIVDKAVEADGSVVGGEPAEALEMDQLKKKVIFYNVLQKFCGCMYNRISSLQSCSFCYLL